MPASPQSMTPMPRRAARASSASPVSRSKAWPCSAGTSTASSGGALGNEVAKNLTMMGVQLIVVVDRDTVDLTNLTRSVFYREADRGLPKATVLAGRLSELNPDVAAWGVVGSVPGALGLGVLRR